MYTRDDVARCAVVVDSPVPVPFGKLHQSRGGPDGILRHSNGLGRPGEGGDGGCRSMFYRAWRSGGAATAQWAGCDPARHIMHKHTHQPAYANPASVTSPTPCRYCAVTPRYGHVDGRDLGHRGRPSQLCGSVRPIACARHRGMASSKRSVY